MAPVEFEITKGLTAQQNMDLDRSNLLAGRALLRFYSWQPAGLSLGVSEQADEIVDFEACERQGVEVVKRLTGGAAVLHRDDFTYSIVLPRDIWPQRSLHALYDTISRALQDGLQSLGIEVQRAAAGPWKMPDTHVCFQGPSKNEILVEGRKIVGSAQCHKRRAILQHGSLMIKNHTAELCSLLKINDPCAVDAIVAKTIALDEVAVGAGHDFDAIATAMQQSFRAILAEYDLDLH